MYKDLLFNLMLMVSIVTIVGQIFRGKDLILNIYTKIAIGAFGGILGTVLMLFAIGVNETTKVDLRYLVVVLVCLYIGKTAGVVAALVIGVNRILLFGVNISSLTNLTTITLLVVCCIVICGTKMSNFKKFMIMNALNIFLFGGAIKYVVSDAELALSIIAFYGIISLIGGFFAHSVCGYVVESNENYKKIKEMSSTDYLTGLNNVRQFDTIWTNYVEKSKQINEKFSLLLIDIDNFKQVNDKHGHLVGDMILQEIGEIFSNATRSNDIVSRNGGEEFSILLPNCRKKQAIETAERIRAKVAEQDFVIDNEVINITVSIGVASYPESTIEVEKIINLTDQHLSAAKNQGGNRVIFKL